MTDPIFDHEKLDVYRLSVDYVGFAYGIAKTLTGPNGHVTISGFGRRSRSR